MLSTLAIRNQKKQDDIRQAKAVERVNATAALRQTTAPVASHYGHSNAPVAPHYGHSNAPVAPHYGHSNGPAAPHYGHSNAPAAPHYGHSNAAAPQNGQQSSLKVQNQMDPVKPPAGNHAPTKQLPENVPNQLKMYSRRRAASRH